MKKYIFIMLAVFGIFLLFPCDILPAEIRNTENLDDIVRDFINVPWILSSATIDDDILDLSNYDTFHFLIGDTLVYGDDGCNWYYGEYFITDNMLDINEIWQTLIICDNSLFGFDPFYLAGRLNVELNDNKLTVMQQDTILVFTSEFAESIDKYPLVDRRWILQSSNDTTFHILEEYDLLPELHFTQKREFELRWYFERNFIGGAFGVDSEQSIYFYDSGGSYSKPEELQSREDIEFVRRITESTNFSFTDTSLTLLSQDDDIYYEFTIFVTNVDNSVDYEIDFTLYQNYPNPFNPVTTISYELPNRAFVNLTIYNINGQKVETLVNNEQEVGRYQIVWDASSLPSGVYYYRLRTEDYVKTKNMLLIQ